MKLLVNIIYEGKQNMIKESKEIWVKLCLIHPILEARLNENFFI